MGAASVLMVAGVSLLMASPASAIATTTTAITSATPPSTDIVGNSIQFVATISNGSAYTGTVTFSTSPDGSTWTDLGDCMAVSISGSTSTCNTVDAPLGTMDVRAVYSGDGNNSTSTSPNFPYTVTSGNTVTSTALAGTTPSNQVVGSNVNLTATVSGGPTNTGTVTFKVSTNGSAYSVISACTGANVAAGQATCMTSLPVLGTVDFEAVYSGTNIYTTSTSAPYAYSVITGGGTSSVSLAATPVSPVGVGTSVTMTATVTGISPAGSPISGTTGTMNFEYSTGSGYLSVGACSSVSAPGGVATCTTTTLPFGTVDLEAVYSGNSIYQTVTSAVTSYVVRASSSSTIGATPASPTPYGTSVTLTSTVVTGATGTVNFETSTNDVTFTSIAGCSAEVVSVTYVATCTTNGLPTGTDYLEAVYSGNTTYAPSTSTPTIYVVNPASQAALTVTSTAGLVGTALTLVTGGGSGTGAVTFSVVNGTATGCAISGTSLKVTTAGTCIVTASKASDGNYLVASSVATTVTFVNPIPRAIRVVGAPVVGQTTVIAIAGQYFYGQPTMITNAPGVIARVTKDTGSLLTVRVSVRSGVRSGIYVFALTFKNGQRTNVKYNLR